MKTFYYLTCFMLAIFSFTASAQNFNYLGSYDNRGTPNYLENPGDNISDDTHQLIDNAIPETFRVPTYNPHYITSSYDTDVFLTAQTEVFVTFVSEGAGFRNVLGFYTYDPNNPPTEAPADEDVTIIFPNASARGSGGGLRAGDKVSLGTFPAGTAIGWVLLSNGWNGNQVGYGYWQLYSNPNFNPESTAERRQHNVLIKDDTEELVILGFEDINRDVSWCDHDFNDAVFYVTATSYEDIITTNNVSTATSTDVFSSNLAGFESNGDLAGQIAKRSIDRLKNKKQADHKTRQAPYRKGAYRSRDLGNYFPETGMNSFETPFIATSLDLVNYANADEVFSVDYYIGDNRVSAGLVTSTTGEIYNHAKAICDRLNGSKLLDLRNVTLNGYEMLFAIIERNNGTVEYAISFSIKEGEDGNKLYSLWNISDYPEGNYKNFQVWGASMGQVAHIVNHVIDRLVEEQQLITPEIEHKLPSVFISSAYYRNEKLHLDIINKSSASTASITANLKRSENAELEEFSTTVALSGAWEEHVVVETGFLFDVGLSFLADGSAINDALYLADGPWGVDYQAGDVDLESFEIASQTEQMDDDPSTYQMERSISASGTASGTFNIFRTVLPGDLSLDVSNFSKLNFDIQNNIPLEIALIPEGLTDWSQRLRYQLPVNELETSHTLNFEEFVDHDGNHQTLTNVRTIIFSVAGTASAAQSFDLSVGNLFFNGEPEPAVVLSVDGPTTQKLINYPNPFNDFTTITLTEKTPSIDLFVHDLSGRLVYSSTIATTNDGTSAVFHNKGLERGIYRYVVVQGNGNRSIGSFVIQ